LIQIQVTIIYLSTVVAKLAGETWQNGTAVAYSLRQRDMLVFAPPGWILDNLVVANVLTWGTLVIEVAIGVLVWKQKWRPWVLGMGVVLHLSISFALEVGFFSAAMFVLYLAFIPPERVKAFATRLKKRIDALTSRFRRGDDAADDDNHWPEAVDVTHTDEDDERARPSRYVQRPDVPALQAGTAPDPAKHNGHRQPVNNGSMPRRLAEDPPNGHRVREGTPAPRRLPVPPHDVGDGSMPRRLAEVAPNGHRVREGTPAPTRLPVPPHNVDDEPSGRHARRTP
jgi:hypothetical protein